METVARRGSRRAGRRARPCSSWRGGSSAIVGEGLRRIGAAGRRDPDERGFLEPIRAQLELGKSPGEVVLERWEGDWDRSLERLIEYARY